jgi:Paraquat-inducible protein A
MEAVADPLNPASAPSRRRLLTLGALLLLNVLLLWLGLTEDAVTVGVTVKKEVFGFAIRLSDERATYSVLDAIWKLRTDGNTILFVLIALFSVAFPMAKLAGNIYIWFRIATSRSSEATRQELLLWTRRLGDLGKWSMLEVFMAGLLCALLKAGDMVRVVIEPALYWFVAAVLLSIVNATQTKRIVAGP